MSAKTAKRHRSRRRWASLLGLPLTIAIAWGVLLAAGMVALPGVIDRLIPAATEAAGKIGVGLSDVMVGRAHPAPFLNGVTLRDTEARFDLDLRDDVRFGSMAEIDRLSVRVRSISPLRGSVEATGLAIRMQAEALPPWLPFDRLTKGQLLIDDLPLARPDDAIDEIKAALTQLFIDNRIVGRARFSGDASAVVNDERITVRLFSEPTAGGVRLRANRTDVRALSDRLALDLAPEQIEIVSLYPLRMPLVMKLTDQARDLSRRQVPRDGWLRDALLHVSWSYLLASEFGADFAVEVTNAQEARPGNTPNERAMDYHNNAVGRRLAAEGVPLGALPDRVRRDPAIIRHPDEVSRFAPDRLMR